ncbi:MAG: hypothetical protein BA874_02865 [Desulfuromonadales bacterium C00003068]|jgi:predicted cupin superfamily sugar epimerase|nr:MAG: hypothetical protein BA874_02865 [Desulfuromonadales bacterium C00003068]
MKELIDRYGLIPHPEGGFYKEVYRSTQTVISNAVHSERQALTHIYFLLTKGQVSRFHKVCHDEIWNFYEGSPLRLLSLHEGKISEQLLGSDTGNYVAIIHGGSYQAAESTGDYSLVGCSVAPGFDFNDFSFLSDDSLQQAMIANSAPELKRFI